MVNLFVASIGEVHFSSLRCTSLYIIQVMKMSHIMIMSCLNKLINFHKVHQQLLLLDMPTMTGETLINTSKEEL